jgi:hypothetical protein
MSVGLASDAVIILSVVSVLKTAQAATCRGKLDIPGTWRRLGRR